MTSHNNSIELHNINTNIVCHLYCFYIYISHQVITTKALSLIKNGNTKYVFNKYYYTEHEYN